MLIFNNSNNNRNVKKNRINFLIDDVDYYLYINKILSIDYKIA